MAYLYPLMNRLKAVQYFLIFCIICQQVSAQPGGGGDPGGGEPVPIGGIWILLVVGASLGLKRLIDLRKNKHQ